jgi:Phospholipase_D-nuclease N-terminal
MADIIGGIVGIGFLVLWIYCIFDVITTDDAIIRHLPKLVWLLIVFFLPDIGSLLWLGLGRPRVWTRNVHSRERSGQGPSFNPADPLDGRALDGLDPIVRHREEQARLRLWEAQLQRREEELKRTLGEGSS